MRQERTCTVPSPIPSPRRGEGVFRGDLRMKLSLLLVCLASTGLLAATIPQKFTYQGTLKDAGAPANGLYQMRFRFCDANGQLYYWSAAADVPVNVKNGYFAAVITPNPGELAWPIDWQNVIPYLEVTVNGNTVLLP